MDWRAIVHLDPYAVGVSGDPKCDVAPSVKDRVGDQLTDKEDGGVELVGEADVAQQPTDLLTRRTNARRNAFEHLDVLDRVARHDASVSRFVGRRRAMAATPRYDTAAEAVVPDRRSQRTPLSRRTSARPSGVPCQWRSRTSAPATRTTDRNTRAMTMTSSA